MGLTKKALKLILTPIIIILVLALILGITAVVLLNMTPNKLGFGDAALINGESLNSLGLGDTKIYNLLKSFKGIAAPDEGKIIKNNYDATIESPKAKSNLEDSNISTDSDGNPNYESIIANKITYDYEYLLSYEDNTLAYIFNQMIADATESNADVKAIKDMKASVKEITISTVGTKKSIRLVLSVDISEFKGQIKAKLGTFGNLVKVPSNVYVVSYLNVDSVDTEGKLVLSSSSLKINDQGDALSKAIFGVICANANLNSENCETEINNKLISAFTTTVANLGKIGTATTDETGLITSDKVIGLNGVVQGKITVITYTAGPVG